MSKAAKKESKNKKRGKWLKFRHRIVRNLLYGTLGVYCCLRYRMKIKRFREQEKRPYLILFNHQTPFDQFFVGMAFKGPVYYVASEDIFSNGWVSSLIRYLVAPIPIKKQAADVKAVMTCLRVAREGGTIAIAPEGNRTYSGKTEYISPSIVPLARKLNMPIALYRLEGGYGVHPRWSDVVRRGKMCGYVSRVLSPEEYSAMTDEELLDAIKSELYVNEAKADAEFRHKKTAEYLERAIYVCPFCGLSEFESDRDRLTCKRCRRTVRYLATKELVGVDYEHPFRFLAEWYDYQADFINRFDTDAATEEPLFCDTVDFYEVIPYKKKQLLEKQATLLLYGDRVEILCKGEPLSLPFARVSAATVLGRNKLNFYIGDKIYQCKGSPRFNALKYVHIHHRCKNILKGEPHEQFLGL